MEKSNFREQAIEFLKLKGIYGKYSKEDEELFLKTAEEFELSPFKREIYAVENGKKDKLQTLVGYEVFLKRAQRTEKLAGFKVSSVGQGNELVACCEIHRHDWKVPLVHEVEFAEYCQYKFEQNKKVPNKMWASKPITMLKKVAMSQAFRLAFPDEMGGLYTREEMPDDDDIVPKSTTKEVPAHIVQQAQQISPPSNLAAPKDEISNVLKSIMTGLKLEKEQTVTWVKEKIGAKKLTDITNDDLATLVASLKAEVPAKEERKDDIPW